MVCSSLRSSRLKENESSEPSGRSQLQEGLWGLSRRVRADLSLTSTLPCWHVPSPWMKGQIPSIEGAAYFLVFLSFFFFFPENGYHLRLHAARFNQIFMTGRTSLIALSVPACPAWYWKVLPAWWTPPCPRPSPTPQSLSHSRTYSLFSIMARFGIGLGWPMSNGASQLVLVVKNPPANAGHVRGTTLIPRLGRSLWGGQGNPLQYSFLENPTDRGACWATVHRVSKSRLWLKWLGMPGCPMNQCVMDFFYFFKVYFKFFCICFGLC